MRRWAHRRADSVAVWRTSASSHPPNGAPVLMSRRLLSILTSDFADIVDGTYGHRSGHCFAI